jgi:lipid II:glycine glycyltransferase (peptidoglycan interpeptide bridge formation enzyme)
MLTEDAVSDIQLIRSASEQQLAAWDAFVAATPDSDVTQLSAWARVRRSAGFEPVYLIATRHGELVGGAQVLMRRVARVTSVAYVPFGPVLRPDTVDRERLCAALASGLQRLARSGVGLLFLQPPSGADDVSAELLRRGFRQSDALVAPQASIRLDLSRDEDELRGRMNKRLRAWTNRWAQRGVTVRLGSHEDVPLLADLLARTAEHQQFDPLSPAYVRLLYEELAAGGNAVLFVGEVDGRAVGVDLFTCCGGVVRDRLVGFDRAGPASKLSVPGAIKWEAIRWAKDNGFRAFDFGSIELGTATALLAGQRLDPATASGGDFFKISFGGDPYINPPAVEAASSRLVLAAYDAIRRSERGRRVLDRAKRRLRSSD